MEREQTLLAWRCRHLISILAIYEKRDQKYSLEGYRIMLRSSQNPEVVHMYWNIYGIGERRVGYRERLLILLALELLVIRQFWPPRAFG